LGERQIAQEKIEKSVGGGQSLSGQIVNGQNLDSAVSRDTARNLKGNSE
jgi:hypothetical protein